MIFKAKFGEVSHELKAELAAGTQVCADLRANEKFQKLLEILLLVGNFMNSGSSNLEASIGFDMRYLPKFYTTKANDNKRTLLHLVAQIVTEKNPLIANFFDDFGSFMDTACKSTSIVHFLS